MTISNEAIEAAARAMFASEQCDLRQKQDLEANWIGRLNDHDRDEYRRLTTAALSAAAPIIRAEALREAADAMWELSNATINGPDTGHSWLRARADQIDGGSE